MSTNHLSVTTLALLIVFGASGAFAAPSKETLGSAPTDPFADTEINAKKKKFWQSQEDGWFWYQDPEEEMEEPPEAIVDKMQQLKSTEQVQEALNFLRDQAILRPSETSLMRYQYAQQWAMRKSTIFADTWKRVVYQTPDLDYSLKRPTNNAAIKVHKAERRRSDQEYIAQLVKEGSGLFFFFESTCPYCQKMAPTLKTFSQLTGMKVLPITLDGKGLPDYPNPRVDSGQAEMMKATTVPAIFIVSPDNKHPIVPIAYGVISLSEIATRITDIMQYKPGDTW